MSTTVEPAVRVDRPRRVRQQRGEFRSAMLFLSPWIIGFLVFTAGPMVASLVLSLNEYDAINPPSYVGTDNYERLFEDPRVLKSLWNTVIYTVLHVPLAMALALALAMLLVRLGRSSGIFRTIIYLPVMTPPVAIGILFLMLLNGQVGLVNEGLSVIGIRGPDWTTDPDWIKPGMVLMSLWTVGSTAILYLAALKDVPRELYDSASIDGASPWQRFRMVTVPMISGTLFFTLIVNTIASLQMFTEAYTMFFGGNDTQQTYSSDAALFYVVYLFQQAFNYLDMGYASAMAWLLFLVIMVITVVQIRMSKRFVHYEGGE
ncbi:MAG: sugar ABC transporter permease [Actinomycetota bacterium]|nr:sugar ABC transporter permease [Actinomycetota bacterium]